MRLAYYAGASTAAAAGCLLKAFHQRPNFYSATVYLSQSNACLLILTNLLLVCACTFMYGLQRALYGPLRPIEIEQLSEKAWYAVLDTLLAMPSFREDVGGWLLFMFVLLLAGKVWGWIGEGRVDVLEQQPPANPRLFHARLATSLVISLLFDVYMLDYCIETVMGDPRPGMMVIFTFEFAILCIFSTFTLSRYCLSVYEAGVIKRQTRLAIEARKIEIRAERAAERQNETEDGRPAPASPPREEPIEVDENEVDVPGWEEKRRYLFALEVFTDFLKLLIYIFFFAVSITFNGLPMHIMRDVYMTFASFSKRVNDYVNYRKATSDMNTKYPDATEEEIRGDACIVCRETMVAWEQPNAAGGPQVAGEQPAVAPAPARSRDEGLRAKKLPCGHILHLRCLKAWLERQQVCPTCRRPVITAPPPPPQPPLPPGQAQGQAGVQGVAPGQAGQQQAARPNRARIFNLGPIRIGFMNGPANEMQNVINQIRNGQPQQQQQQQQQQQPQQQQPQPDGGQQSAADQQGPNHLGLQVPYLPQQNGTATTNGGIDPGARASVPTNIQLMQIEQRLIQQAHNLGLEQQQLQTLRMMEGELARLRAIQSNGPQQQPGWSQTPWSAMSYQLPTPFHGPVVQNTLHGNTRQQYSGGSAQLPEGMTLPDGWTVMPLQRLGYGPSQTIVSDPHVPAADAQQLVPPDGSVDQGGQGQTQQPEDSRATSQMAAENVNGAPTNGDGEPLFTTAQPSVNGVAVPDQGSPRVASNANAPWAEASWNFGDSSSSHDVSNTAASHSAGSVAERGEGTNTGGAGQEEQDSHAGKGKGKPVQVEEAPDSGT